MAINPQRENAGQADRDAVGALTAERVVADENWLRYEYIRDRGHDTYAQEVRRLEDYVLGGGRQWSEEDKQILKEQGRLPLEFNEILPAVKAAIGYQIANRMDISFQPRGGLATQEIANVLSQVAMQVADNCRLHWKETEVFTDGLIQRRGFYDIRIDFDDSMRGEIAIDVLDPMDVLIDPDAKGYDPATWGDVIVTRWLALDDIEQRYGAEARQRAEEAASALGSSPVGEPDFGDDDDTAGERGKFGTRADGLESGWHDAIRRDRHMTRLRVIDRQKWVYQMVQVVVRPDTGDVRVVEGLPPEKIRTMVERGGILTRRMARRVRWIVTTRDAVLHDDWSPYPFLTVVPYFPFFRRGRSIGLVDNAVGPQDALNKLASQYIHIINTTANSGWEVEEGALVNMTVEDLEENGAKTGLVIEKKKGAEIRRIEPAKVPTGVDHMIDRMMLVLKENTVPDAARGIDDDSLSGVSRQAKQFAAQQQLAAEIDNLSRTRHMLAERILYMIQTYYDEHRIYRITKNDPATGQPADEVVEINKPDPVTGEILNDLTLGEYTAIITEQPTTVTFEDSTFEQAKAMRELGVQIPDHVLIQNSRLPNKAELLQELAAQGETRDPLAEAEARLKEAQARKADADATARAVEAQFSAIQTAQVIAQTPATAPLADSLLRSAGYEDQDEPPIVPMPPEGIAAGVEFPSNTNPLTPLNPPSPVEGVNRGIETPEADSVI